MLDPTDLAGEEERATKAEAEVRGQTILAKADLVWLMGEARGRRFIWRLLDKAGVFRTSFTGNSATFFNEGQRNIGLWVQAMLIEHCPDKYFAMLNEQKDYRK